MLDFLRRLFTVNIGFKITALLIALGITHMKYEDNSSTVTAELAVSPILPKDQVLMTQPVERVTITIEGKYTDLRKFDTKTLDALEPNLSGIHQGQINFQANAIKLPAGLRVTKIDPPAMLVMFEPLTVREVPVEATLVGEPTSGYRLINDSVTPSTLTISGAASIVNAIQHVQTERITLTGRRESSKFSVQLASPPEHVTYQNPQQVYEVDIEIEEIRGTRAIADRPVEIRVDGNNDEFEAFPETVYVTLSGPMRKLEALDRAKVRPYIDLSDSDSMRQAMQKKGIRVSVELPAGLSVTEVKPDAVRVFRRESKAQPAEETQSGHHLPTPAPDEQKGVEKSSKPEVVQKHDDVKLEPKMDAKPVAPDQPEDATKAPQAE